MTRFFLISVLSIIMFSCKPYQIDNQKHEFVKGKIEIENKHFSVIGEEHILRANITAFNKEISGLLVVKKMNDSLHRVVLTSDFGNTLFDFNIYPDSYGLNYVMDDLNKKIIIRVLGNDFVYLVKNNYLIEEQTETDSALIYKTKEQGRNLFLVKDKKGNDLKKLIIASKYKEKVSYNFLEKGEEEKIIINHKNIPLTIRLK